MKPEKLHLLVGSKASCRLGSLQLLKVLPCKIDHVVPYLRHVESRRLMGGLHSTKLGVKTRHMRQRACTEVDLMSRSATGLSILEKFGTSQLSTSHCLEMIGRKEEDYKTNNRTKTLSYLSSASSKLLWENAGTWSQQFYHQHCWYLQPRIGIY